MKCKNKNCDGLLLASNTFYDEKNTAFRRRKCNKCKLVIYTTESEISHNEFYKAMSNYYKQRRMAQGGENDR